MRVLLTLVVLFFVVGCDANEPLPPKPDETAPPADQGEVGRTPIDQTQDGIDNDEDGQIDEPDEAPDLTLDGLDNDGDGEIDEPDEAELN